MRAIVAGGLYCREGGVVRRAGVWCDVMCGVEEEGDVDFPTRYSI